MADEHALSATAPTSAVVIRDATVSDAPAMARLMYDEVHWGRIRDFGVGFLTVLNKAFCTSPNAVCVVALVDGRVVGFLSGTTHLGRFYRDFALRHGFSAAVAILPRLLSPRRLKTLLRALMYRNDPRPGGPQAELMTIAVAPGFKGQRIGWRLTDAVMKQLRGRGVDAVRAMMTAGNERSLGLFAKYGFRIAESREFYDSESQVHMIEYRFDP